MHWLLNSIPVVQDKQLSEVFVHVLHGGEQVTQVRVIKSIKRPVPHEVTQELLTAIKKVSDLQLVQVVVDPEHVAQFPKHC